MDFPTNAAYGPMDAPKEEPRAMMIAGFRIPGQQVWMVGVGILGLVAAGTLTILFALPSGIPVLAAKFAGGFFEYVALFFIYMIGFFFLAIVLGALLAVAGAQAIPFLTRNNG